MNNAQWQIFMDELESIAYNLEESPSRRKIAMRILDNIRRGSGPLAPITGKAPTKYVGNHRGAQFVHEDYEYQGTLE